MSLFEQLKFKVERKLSPNKTRITEATYLWLYNLCELIEDRIEDLKIDEK